MIRNTTFDVDYDGPIDFWFGIDLAFVQTRIFSLSRVNPQLPVVQRFISRSRDASVARMADTSRRQDRQIWLAHPRDLNIPINKNWFVVVIPLLVDLMLIRAVINVDICIISNHLDKMNSDLD